VKNAFTRAGFERGGGKSDEKRADKQQDKLLMVSGEVADPADTSHEALPLPPKPLSSRGWTALWSKHQNAAQLKALNCLQKVNHFPSSWCIGRKDRLMRTINSMKRVHGSHFDFHPDAFILPAERAAFLRQVKTDLSHVRGRYASIICVYSFICALFSFSIPSVHVFLVSRTPDIPHPSKPKLLLT
jgi:hypothetical protein